MKRLSVVIMLCVLASALRGQQRIPPRADKPITLVQTDHERIVHEERTPSEIDWEVVHHARTEFFRSLSFPSADTGYAAGGFSLYRTYDAGRTWQKLALTSPVYSCYFKTPTHGFMVGGSTLYETSDAGESWQSQATRTVNLESIAYYNRDTLLCLGEADVARSIRPGEWQDIHLGGADRLTGCALVGGRAFAVGWSQRFADLTKPEAAALYVSTDVGGSWSSLYSQVRGDLWAIGSPGDSSLVAVGGGKGHERLLVTTNSGKDWQQDSTSVNAQLRSISFSPSGRIGVAVGYTALVSYNGGRIWSRCTFPGTDLMAAVAVLDDSTILIAGDSGYIYRGRLSPKLNVIEKDRQPVASLAELAVYPNPLTSRLNVSFTLSSASEIACLLLSSTGEKIRELQHARWTQPGVQTMQVDVRGLSTGSYLLVLYVNGDPTTRMIQVKHQE